MEGEIRATAIAETLFHLAQVYELATTLKEYKDDELYRAVLLELAQKLLYDFENAANRG